MKRLSVSIVVPAFNEERSIEDAVNSVIKVCQLARADYEIIVYDDGSVDRTGEIADAIAKRNRRVRVVHNQFNRGLGFCFSDFLRKAKKKYWMFYPGDADMASWSLLELMKALHSEALVISYPRNMSARSYSRRILARLFTAIMNALMGITLLYYPGSFICLVEPVRKLKLTSYSFAAFFEFKIHLIKSGYSYKEIPFDHVGRIQGGSKAFTPGSIVDTLATVLRLFLRYRLGIR